MSPFALRRDEPAALPKTDLPPDFAEFYLDAQHAWIARSVNLGSNLCYDHAGLFATADGGLTWTETLLRGPADTPPRTQPGYNIQIYFLDSEHGWVRIDPFLYATADGGRTWNLVSTHGIVGCTFSFTSPSVGWAGGCGATSGNAYSALVLNSRDGGATWSTLQLPTPPHGCGCSVDLPHFSDNLHGVVIVWTDWGEYAYSTSDGGVTWRVLPNLPVQPQYAPATDFSHPPSLWYAALPSGWQRGDPGPLDSLYHSADGGSHWSLVQARTPIGYGLCCIPMTLQFVDSLHGMVVQSDQVNGGDAAVLLVTADGGRTWRTVRMHPPQ